MAAGTQEEVDAPRNTILEKLAQLQRAYDADKTKVLNFSKSLPGRDENIVAVAKRARPLKEQLREVEDEATRGERLLTIPAPVDLRPFFYRLGGIGALLVVILGLRGMQ